VPPTVSINLCCYNSERYLRETLESVINQTYKDWELVVIDDGSKDSTASIIGEYISRGYPIFYHYQENKGLGYSRNRAFEYSRGKYIAFIDHDDVWMADKLEKQIRVIKSRPDIDFLYSNYYRLLVYAGNRRVLALKGNQPEGDVFNAFVRRYNVFISSVIVTKTAIDSLNSLFDERFNQIEELDLFLRLLYKRNAAYINEPLAVYRIHENMTTIKAPELVPQECQYLLEKLIEMDPAFSSSHKEIAKYIQIQLITYNQAKFEILHGNPMLARQWVAPYKWYSTRVFFAYLATFFSGKLALSINELILKLKRRSRLKSRWG